MTEVSKPTADGGRTALGGFLYQMIGAWGMMAWTETVQDSADSSELNAVIKLMRQGGRVRHEADDQDLAVELPSFGMETSDELVLVQFKYSRQQPPKALGSKEITEIARSFKRSGKQAQARGQAVARYVVVTNRRSPSLEAPSHEKRPDNQQRNTASSYTTTREGIDITFVTRIPITLWYDKLSSFAAQYGCFKDEIDRGIDRLIGRLANPLLYDPATPLSREFLAEAFTGFSQPHTLTCRRISKDEHEVQYMQERREGLQLPEKLVRRTALDELDRLVLERSLILMTGLGGVGKSTALWAWVDRQRMQMAQSRSPITCLRMGDEVNDHCIADILRLWSNDALRSSPRGGDSTAHALERLQLANPGATHPIFVLGLDGLDEEIPSELNSAIRKLVAWFKTEDQTCRSLGQPPRATLIVACRDEDDFYQKWAYRDVPSLTNDHERDPKPLQVNRFTWPELYEGARTYASELVKPIEQRGKRGEGLALPSTVSPYSTLPSSFSSSSTYITSAIPAPLAQPYDDLPVAESLLTLLRNPVLWQAYISTPMHLRSLIIQGSSEGLRILARWFAHRFCHKARRRGVDHPPDAIGEVLRMITRDCPPAQNKTYTFGQWRAAAADIRPLEMTLWREAETTGLIREVTASEWQWEPQLTFICTYLEEAGGRDLRSRTRDQPLGGDDDE